LMLDMSHTARCYRLIQDIIEFLELDLEGVVVLTEIGSGNFIYTPFIAACAGSTEVYCLAKDSPYGSAKQIVADGLNLASQWDLTDRLHIVPSLDPATINKADIVTNLGFLRPIDRQFISHMKPGSVIPYMREAWEYRREDVDLTACKENNIPVMGTYENYNGLDVFDACGPLAAKMLFEIGLEVKDNNIIVISRDNFGDLLFKYLSKCEARVKLVGDNFNFHLENKNRIDALVIANFTTEDLIVGKGGWIDPSKLALLHPECNILQIVGKIDPETIMQSGLNFFPSVPVEPKRMSKTLAHLGPKPVIDLHAAGLKVGELMLGEMRASNDSNMVIEALDFPNSLCQEILT
jgi:hypothetical protein